MNCTEFEAAIERSVENRQSLVASELLTPLLQHAETCVACRAILDQQQQLELAIKAWRSAQPPAALLDAVLTELTNPIWDEDPEIVHLPDYLNDGSVSAEIPFDRVSTPIKPPTDRSSRAAGWAVVSAAVCLFIVTSIVVNTSNRSADRARTASPRTTTVAATPVDVSGTLTAVLSDLQSEYQELASETTSVARDVVNAIPAAPTTVSVLTGSEEIEFLPDSSGVVRMWQPIGSSVETAFGFLWQAVPSQSPAG